MFPVPALQAVWRYRGFVLGSVARDFQLRYRYSMLGAAWTLLAPAAMIAVYALVFSQIMQARLPGVAAPLAYTIYLCAGVLTWNLFAEIVTRGQAVFVEQGALLRKVSFPRLCLPLVVVLNALVNFAVVAAVFAVFLLLAGHAPGWAALGLLPVLVLLVLLAIGLGVALGVLNVFFRDVGQAVGIGMQFLFWLTPIVYPASILPPQLASALQLNPLVPLLGACQRVLVEGLWPQWHTLLTPALLAALLCVLGLWLFRRHAADMVDEL